MTTTTTTTELETRSRRSRRKEATHARLETAGELRGPSLEAAGDEKPASSSDARWALLGPLWAAYGGWWGMFLISAALELIGLVLLSFGYSMLGTDDVRSLLLLGAGGALLVGVRLALRRFASSPGLDRPAPTNTRFVRGALAAAIIAFTYTLTLIRFNGDGLTGFLSQFPAPAAVAPAVALGIDQAVDWSIVAFGAFFEAIRVAIFWILNGIEAAFVRTPWPVVGIFILMVAWRTGGVGVLAFSACALTYLGIFGFWEKSMSTLALVAASVLVCVAIGAPLGVLAAKSRRFGGALEPVLDVMQTLPTFVYLIPAVAFFSIGKPPGVIATVIFAMPPMIRLTALGIRQVPHGVKEAALAFGATPYQLLRKVELPLAVPSVLAGINQVIMMSLSMVVIAGLIGAGGLGVEVIRALNFLQIGYGFLVGIAIVLMAMTLDRIVRGRGDGLHETQK